MSAAPSLAGSPEGQIVTDGYESRKKSRTIRAVGIVVHFVDLADRKCRIGRVVRLATFSTLAGYTSTVLRLLAELSSRET